MGGQIVILHGLRRFVGICSYLRRWFDKLTTNGAGAFFSFVLSLSKHRSMLVSRFQRRKKAVRIQIPERTAIFISI